METSKTKFSFIAIIFGLLVIFAGFNKALAASYGGTIISGGVKSTVNNGGTLFVKCGSCDDKVCMEIPINGGPILGDPCPNIGHYTFEAIWVPSDINDPHIGTGYVGIDFLNQESTLEGCTYTFTILPDPIITNDYQEWVNLVSNGSYKIGTTTSDNPLKNSHISIFPNPVSEQFAIVFNGLQQHSDLNPSYRLKIFNLLGQTIYSQANVDIENSVTIDAQHWQIGNYMVEITNDYNPNFKYVAKFVISR
ncbi:MAG TPA: T9SS type A sorting domain-containing protein [Candidatus Kapabacteria bacterium]|jgi:hypothetical protein|nr:T9SS type A sorting domain-containing protein [Candidatus Kapabacteria bacterium]